MSQRKLRSWMGRSSGLLALVVAALVVAVSAALNPVAAQFQPDASDEPYWSRRLNCDPALQAFQGLHYCTGLNGRAHVLVVDLYDQSGLSFEYVIAAGTDRNGRFGPCRDVNLPAWSSGPGCSDTTGLFPIMSLQQAATRIPAAAAVFDTDYGAMTGGERDHGPEGLAIIDGQRIDGPALGDADDNAIRRPWLALSAAAPFQAALGQLSTDYGAKPFPWIDVGVGGAPWLIREGVIDEAQIAGCANATGHSCDSTRGQAAVGLSRGGRWLYVAFADGVDAAGLAHFMFDHLNPWSAIKFDGGGSTQLWYDGRAVLPGDGRWLSQYMAIVAPRGDGVQFASPALAATPLESPDVIILDEGQTATLEPVFRNDGVVVWMAGNGISLAEKPALDSPFGRAELIALPYDVAPGATVSWSFPAPTSGVHTYRYGLIQDELYFGQDKQYLVIVLPQALQDQREELEQIIADAQAKGAQGVEELLAAVEQWLVTEGEQLAQGLLDRLKQFFVNQASQLWQDIQVEICGGPLLIPVLTVVGLVVARRRR